MKFLKLWIVKSVMQPNHLSIRLGPDATTATGFKRALVASGFKAGDRAVLISEDEYDRLTRMQDRHYD